MKKSILAACIASAYLLVYLFAFNYNAPVKVLIFLFVFSPVMVIWMAVTILKDNSVDVAELKADEEYGYQDKPKSMLRTF